MWFVDSRDYPNGKLMLRKAEPEGKEFFRSSDLNSRFINTAVGPDGCLYVTDMYRGIIQDAPWFNEETGNLPDGLGSTNTFKWVESGESGIRIIAIKRNRRCSQKAPRNW